MTTVRFLNAARYAVKLFGYLVAVVVVSAGAVSLGYWIAAPELSPTLGSGTPEYAPLVGGAVLILVGVVVFWIGTLSATYKMIADAVTAGRENVAGPTGTVESETVQATVEEPATGDAGEPLGETEEAPGTAAEPDVAAAAREGARDAQAAAPETANGADVADPSSEAELESVEDGTGSAGVSAAETGSVADAASESAAEAGSATDAEAGSASGEGDEGALVDASPTGQPDRETNPDPPDRETTPEPKWETEGGPTDRETTPEPEWETTPESPDRETSPEPHDRETNPNPPDAEGGTQDSRPEPSAEEIAFGGSEGGEAAGETVGEETAGSSGVSGETAASESDESSESDLGGAWESLDPDDQHDLMWGDTGDDDTGGFEESSTDETVEAVEPDSGEDPLADG